MNEVLMLHCWISLYLRRGHIRVDYLVYAPLKLTLGYCSLYIYSVRWSVYVDILRFDLHISAYRCGMLFHKRHFFEDLYLSAYFYYFLHIECIMPLHVSVMLCFRMKTFFLVTGRRTRKGGLSLPGCGARSCSPCSRCSWKLWRLTTYVFCFHLLYGIASGFKADSFVTLRPGE
jgi:hypothetical protein